MQILPEHRLPTGNDYVCLPSLSAGTASVPDINVLSKKYRGLVEFHGSDKEAFLKPFIKIGTKVFDLSKEKLKASRLEHWVPAFELSESKTFELKFKFIAPLSSRGFILDYEIKNLTKKPLKVQLGAQGCWAGLRVRNNHRYPLHMWRQADQCPELADWHLVLMAGGEAPEFAMAVGGSHGRLDVHEFNAGSPPKGAPKWANKRARIEAGNPRALYWLAAKNLDVAPGATARYGINFGLGLEMVSSAATAVDMKRMGLEQQVESTLRFLNRKLRFTGDSHLDQLLNLNLWFNYFFAMGVTLDSEEFVCLTSRSPHYYVNGAYWDRDSMLWSFPAVLLTDPNRARRMLEYAFGIQGRNIGVHSRFLDGTVLEPGFELDELCAPVIALANYVKNTGDFSLLKEQYLRKGLRQVERTLISKKHHAIQLYETTSGPDDDFEPLPYLAYDNVMVWRMQQALAELKPKMGRDQDVAGHKDLADRIKSAIWKNLTAEGPRGRMFVWSSDLRGNHRFYTSPPGCLQLLPYYGFCEESEQTWKNTALYLHSRDFQYSFAGQPFEEIGCAHSPEPWALGLCNSLLSGRRDKVRPILEKLSFDGGVACEAFEAKTGKPYTGMAFATCAGFLAWSIWKAYGRSEGAQARQAPPPAFKPMPSAGLRQSPARAGLAGGQAAQPTAMIPSPAPTPAPKPKPKPKSKKR